MLRLERIELQLDDFCFSADLETINAGVIAIIGPSGAGKSTLLNIVAGFTEPTDGRVFWGKSDITAFRPADRPIAMLFQDHNLFGHLTVEQNIGLGIQPNLRLKGVEIDQINKAISRVGLDGYAKRKPAQLSGGQQSRVALARILVQQKPLMLLDEPFAALGPSLRREMLDLVAELAEEIDAMALLVTHDPEDARRIATRTILVTDGKASPPQNTLQLFENPPPSLQAYLGLK